MQHRLATALLLLGALLLLASSGIVVSARRGAAPTGGSTGAVVPPATTAIAYPTSIATPTIARTPLFERPATPVTATAPPPVVVTPNSLAISKLQLATTFASIGIELRNNICRMTRYAFVPPVNTAGQPDRWDEDYNFFFSADPARGLNYGSNRLDINAYRTASGQGKNANRSDTDGKFRTEPGLIDAAGGNLTIAPAAPQIDAGVPVPNIADRAGTDYAGSAPDVGARERP